MDDGVAIGNEIVHEGRIFLTTAVPSEENALRYLLATLEWTAEAGIDLFYFAAFDEAWKAGPEGDRGVTWGLWDQDGKPKYGL